MRDDEPKFAAHAMMAFSGMEYGKFEEPRLRSVPGEVFGQYKDRPPGTGASKPPIITPSSSGWRRVTRPGAGFKGCCIAPVDPACKEMIEECVTRKYLKVFSGLTGKYSVHFCHSADGVNL